MPKILLVDDDPQALESTRKILEFSGYEVITAEDGQKALEQVRPIRTPTLGFVPVLPFDLVVTDVRMPRLGGLEFLRALSLCGETVPVILMTAYGRVEDAVWAMKLGAVDFLTKPFNDQVLLESINKALRQDKANREKRQECAQARAKFALLSPREVQVLQGIVAGKPNKVVSAELNISLKTVEAHRASAPHLADILTEIAGR